MLKPNFAAVERQPFYCCLVVFCVVLLHLVAANEFGLGVDEAHYALFALKPDWSFFDHPPMVGWLQLLARPLFFANYSVRLVPIALMLVNNFLLYVLCHRIYPAAKQPVAFCAVVLFNLGLIVQLVGWGMVPDLPLIFFALLTVLALLQLRQEINIKYALLLGVSLGGSWFK